MYTCIYTQYRNLNVCELCAKEFPQYRGLLFVCMSQAQQRQQQQHIPAASHTETGGSSSTHSRMIPIIYCAFIMRAYVVRIYIYICYTWMTVYDEIEHATQKMRDSIAFIVYTLFSLPSANSSATSSSTSSSVFIVVVSLCRSMKTLGCTQ